VKLRWPRGRYNGDRIDGLEARASVHLLWWRWFPILKWNFGAPYFHWLCFSLWTHPHSTSESHVQEHVDAPRI
jgi:hypothetical protein